MLQSMTGYGEAIYEADGLYYCAQIRTVNNKFLKTSMKLPESVNFLEENIEKLIRGQITRGTVYYSLQMKSSAEKPLATVNHGIVRYYVEELNKAVGSQAANCRINLANIINMPGVIEAYTPDEQQQELIEKAVCKVTADALESLKKMRQAEGVQLAADLSSHCDVIENVLNNVGTKAPVVVSEYYEKLQRRVNELLSAAKLNIDEQQMIREVALFADRCDISEEIARLRSHLKLFHKACDTEESVGRRLDFLCQEMFREVNTIGSKASDAQICQWVVDMKCSVERLKEQVQNVE